MKRLLLFVLLCSAVPCAAQRPSVLVRGPGNVPTGGWESIWFPELDDVARTMGLRPLRQVNAGLSVREVRVWIGGSMGYPRSLYRVRIGPDGGVDGQVFHYWRKSDAGSVGDSVPYEEIIRRHIRGVCGPITSGPTLETCPGVPAPADWRAILTDAEAAGLWVLPDEDSLPSRVVGTDGWSMVVELRAGPEYRTYKYHSPALENSPESGRAFRVSRAFLMASLERATVTM